MAFARMNDHSVVIAQLHELGRLDLVVLIFAAAMGDAAPGFARFGALPHLLLADELGAGRRSFRVCGAEDQPRTEVEC